MNDLNYLSEIELFVGIANGDETCFEKIYTAYYPAVYNNAYKIVQSAYLAEEIVQEVFIKLWINRKSVSEINNLGAYLRIITRNHTYTVLKEIARENNCVDDFSKSGNNPVTHQDFDYKEVANILDIAVNLLPPQQKKIYTMYHIDGLKKDQVARDLNISPLTVKAHLRQAVRFLRNQVYLRFCINILLLIYIR